VRKKIVHICYSGTGGQPNVAINIAHFGNENDKDSLHQILFCGIEELSIENKLKCEQKGIHYAQLKKNRGVDIGFYKKLYNYFISEQPDLIMAHINTFHFILKAYSIKKATPIITVEHHSITLRTLSSLIHTQLSLLVSKNIVVLNKEASDFISKKMVFKKPEKIKIIPNGITIPTKSTKKQLENTNCILGIACRLTRGKDIITVLKAFENLPQSNINYELHIAGDGENKKVLEDYVAQLHRKNKIIFLGALNENEMLAFYKMIDIMIVSSEGEGFGLTVIEAFVNNIPCIGSNVTGINSIIIDDYNGMLFEYQNDLQLQEKILYLTTNIAFKEKIVTNAMKTFSEKYSIEKSYCKYKELF
jgi:glycosyltransferase involved in cell wall biosynthesis